MKSRLREGERKNTERKMRRNDKDKSEDATTKGIERNENRIIKRNIEAENTRCNKWKKKMGGGNW